MSRSSNTGVVAPRNMTLPVPKCNQTQAAGKYFLILRPPIRMPGRGALTRSHGSWLSVCATVAASLFLWSPRSVLSGHSPGEM